MLQVSMASFGYGTHNDCKERGRANNNLFFRADILGDKLVDYELTDAVCICWLPFPNDNNIWRWPETKLIFENTSERPLLRTFLVDCNLYYNFTSTFSEPKYRRFLNGPVLFHIAAAFMRLWDDQINICYLQAPFESANLVGNHKHAKGRTMPAYKDIACGMG